MVLTVNQARERFSNFLESNLVCKEGSFAKDLLKELSKENSLEELMPLLLKVFYNKVNINEASLRESPEQVALYLRQRLRIIEEGAVGHLSQYVNQEILKQKFQELLEIVEAIQLHDICAIHIKDHVQYLKTHYQI